MNENDPALDTPHRNSTDQDALEFNRYDPYWSHFRNASLRSSNFLEHYSHSTGNKHLIEAVTLRVKEPHQRLLDIGCGQGRNAIALAQLGYAVVGIDLSQSAIDLARAAAAGKGVAESATFTVASIFDFRRTDFTFRGIYDDGCLQHIVPSLWEQYAQSVRAVAGTPAHFFLLGFSNETVKWKTYQHHLTGDNALVEEDGHYTRLFSAHDIDSLSMLLGPLKSQLLFRQNDQVVWGLWIFELMNV